MPLMVPLGGLHIGRARHDELVNRLQPPASADEFSGQPIEEFLIGGPVPDAAEIIAGFDQSDTEVVLPETVDDHPRQQGSSPLVNVREPSREALPAISTLVFRLPDPIGEVTTGWAEDCQNSRSNIALFFLNLLT